MSAGASSGNRRPAAIARSKYSAASALAYRPLASSAACSEYDHASCEALGVQVVEGEQAGLIVPTLPGHVGDGVAGPGVQLAAEAEREPVVGTVAQERVAKGQVPGGIVRR